MFSKILEKTNKQYYNLDPTHYFSCPGSALEAMLMMTSIILELFTDIDMFQMVEKGKRGGISLLLIDIQNQIINIYVFIIKIKRVHIYCIWTKIIFMVGLWFSPYQLAGLNG